MRRPVKTLLIAIALLPCAIIAICWHVSGKLAQPTRRALETYHKEALANPSERGIEVTQMACLDGKVPTLVVTPIAGGQPGKKGEILRDQVEGEPVFGEIRGLLVMLHGRHGRKEDLLAAAERFCAVGFVCVLPDLPAHGESPVETVQFGMAPAERSLPLEVAQEVSAARGFDELPRYLWGMSMGGSFAVHALAEDKDAWRAAVIVSSFDTLEGVIQDTAEGTLDPIIPVIEKMTRMRGGADITAVRPIDLAPEITTPVLVVHGDRDVLISVSRGRRLFRAFGSEEKQWETVEGGTHAGVLVTPEPLYATMATWLLSK